MHWAERRTSLGEGVGLVGAIDAGQLFVAYQPVIDLAGRRLQRFEALVRWRHPRRGVLYPVDFLPPPSSAGLARRLTYFVINDAARACQSWRGAAPWVGVSVNVWPADLADAGIVALCEERASDIDLTLEVIEEGSEADWLEQPAPAGVCLSLDDFGMGESSLLRLRSKSVTELKLDRLFAERLVTSPRDRSIVAAIVGLAHDLDMTVVVEGIEDADTARICTDIGVDFGQGWAFGRPAANPGPALASWSHPQPA
ncbi:MAG: diguanylate cyclase [Actinomycetota bacterium]|jgi:EAL domain-containing protein (putative c-di-GMP-specific phosphodiesterase class I)|nr:diguanylate cyclase [Actinomycetota bacterium]